MRYFVELGTLVERLWREANLEEQAFPALVMRALSALPPQEHLRASEVIRWALLNPLPSQIDPQGNFGEPPLTLYVGANFYIDLLFWLDGTTSIHQHDFSGAFHVLEGSSVHSHYRFQRKRRINSRLLLGELSLEKTELLPRGATRPIYSGDQLIHSLFHLERPSVTLAIRSFSEEDKKPQYSYRSPGLALDSFYAPQALTRRLQCLRMMHAIQHPERPAFLREYLAQVDLETAVRILDQEFALARGLTEELRAAIAALPDAELAEHLLASFEDSARRFSITTRRRLIQDPELRFFMALLLNLPTREKIVSLIEARYHQPPIELIMSWIEALAKLRPEGETGPNALDVELDEQSLLVLRCLLEGMSMEALKARLSLEYEGIEEEAESLQELCDAFRQSIFFRPLFL